MRKVIGCDVDGEQLEEFMILRAPFYSYIDFEEDTNIDARQYCVVKGNDEKYYLISVYDWYQRDAIRRYEKIDGEIPVIVKDIDESVNYEIAKDCDDIILMYDLDRTSLYEKLNIILKNNKSQKNELRKKIMEAAGFTCEEAFYLFEQAESLEKRANILEKQLGKCVNILRERACLNRNEAYALEKERTNKEFQKIKFQ